MGGGRPRSVVIGGGNCAGGLTCLLRTRRQLICLLGGIFPNLRSFWAPVFPNLKYVFALRVYQKYVALKPL